MRLERNDWGMMKWIRGGNPSNKLSVDSLYNRLRIEPLSMLLRLRR